MREQLPVIFFLSAERSDHGPGANAVSTADLASELVRLGLPHKRVQGCSAGHKETSFLIVGQEHEQDVFTLGVLYKQGTYLRCDSDRNAFLVDLADEGVDYLGVFRKVTPEQAKRNGSYTFDGESGQYYAATDEPESFA